MLMLLAH